MKNIRLIYYSVATRDISMSDLRQILTTARTNNAEQEVCGMLCFENRFFLQILEGPRDSVSELYLDIADDDRHDDLTLMLCEEIEELSFSEWRMGFAGGSEKLQDILKKNHIQSFDPTLMSASEAALILTQMSEYQMQLDA